MSLVKKGDVVALKLQLDHRGVEVPKSSNTAWPSMSAIGVYMVLQWFTETSALLSFPGNVKMVINQPCRLVYHHHIKKGGEILPLSSKWTITCSSVP